MIGVLGNLASTFLPQIINWGAKKLGATSVGKAISGAATSRVGKTLINSAKTGWKGYKSMQQNMAKQAKRGQ